MARFKHATTGAVVEVRDDKVLGSEWVPADEPEKRGPGRPKKSEGK